MCFKTDAPFWNMASTVVSYAVDKAAVAASAAKQVVEEKAIDYLERRKRDSVNGEKSHCC